MRRRIRAAFAVILMLCMSQLLTIAAMAEDDKTAAKELTWIRAAALLPLSGSLASKGVIREAAIELSVSEVNRRWAEQGVPMRLDMTVRDSGSHPEAALDEAKKLYDLGIRLFIAGSSAEVQHLKPWADQNGSVVISYSSTSPSLAVAGDSVFRMVPDDSNQAQALTELLVKENIYGIVPVYRNDVYGRELFEQLNEEFKVYYGTAADTVVYEPDEQDWDKVVRDIEASLEQLDMMDENKAVVVLSFDEAAQLLARSDELGEIRWFGGDTVALSPAILADPEAAERAAAVQLTGVTFGIPELPLAQEVKALVTEQVEAAFIPDALFAYDIPGLAAAVLEQLENPLDTEELKDKLIDLSSSYEGATGWTLLDNNGDRKYYHYDVWQVQQASNTDQTPYEWELVMKYTRNPGAPGYLVPVTSEAVEQAGELSHLFGYPGSSQDLNRDVSRAEFTYMLIQSVGLSGFEGRSASAFVDEEAIDERAIASVRLARQAGIVDGYADGSFQPDSSISLAEALIMLDRALGLAGDATKTDAALTADMRAPEWAKVQIVHVLERGLYVPVDAKIDYGLTKLTLGEASLIVINLIQRSVQAQ